MVYLIRTPLRDVDKTLRTALWETTSQQLDEALARMALTVVDEST
jgi:hypothetical protein